MARQLSNDRLGLIHSYLKEPVRSEPVEAEPAAAEVARAQENWPRPLVVEGVASARQENGTDELTASIALPDPAEWYIPEPMRLRRLLRRIAAPRRSQMASVLALVGFALVLGWLV